MGNSKRRTRLDKNELTLVWNGLANKKSFYELAEKNPVIDGISRGRIKRARLELLELNEVEAGQLPKKIQDYRRAELAKERVELGIAGGEALVETRVTQKSYEETPHKQKMWELAGKLMHEINMPWIMVSFIVELKPQRLLYADSRGRSQYPPIIIAENEKISIEISIEGKGEIDHIHKGLRSHLETGGFSKVLDDIGIWKQGIADNLVRCHKLLRLARKKIEKSYNVSVPIDYRGQPGFTMHFPMTICAEGIEQARGSNHFRDFSYRYEGLGLSFGAYLIYQGVQNQDLKPYEAAHRKLRKRCASWKQTREIAEQRNSLYETQADIRQQMQKFIDMERLPGQCELCS